MGRKRIKERDFSESSTATEEESDGQLIMTEANTPLSEASENLVRAKAQLHAARHAMDRADEAWVQAMKDANLSKIGHKGETIQLITGKTTKDHSRFVKS